MAQQLESSLAVERTMYHRAILVSSELKTEPKYTSWHTMTTADWLGIDLDKYLELSETLLDFHINFADKTHSLDNADSNIIQETIGDYMSLISHTNLMKCLVDVYWSDPAFRNLFPEGTTIYYLYTLCDLHDFGRFCGLNGGIKLELGDDISKMLLSRLAPNLPAREHLHDIDYITGAAIPPDINHNFVPWFFKLIDTFGKIPHRDPTNFFAEGGGYDEWLKRAIEKGQLPFIAKNEEEITADIYKERDMGMSLAAYQAVNERFSIKFDDALKMAIEELVA